MTNILANLIDPLSAMIYAKIQPKSILGSREEGFYHIWAWRLYWSTNRDHFSNLLFPLCKEAPYEI